MIKKIIVLNLVLILTSLYLKGQEYKFNKQDSLYYNSKGEICNGSFLTPSNTFEDSSEIKFVEGKEIERIYYYPNGEIMSKTYSYPIGLTIVWYENGALQQFNFIKNGEIDGELKVWYKNGMLRSITTYKNGVKEGVSKSWHTNGKLAWESFFCNNRQCGDTKSWFPSGILADENISNGKGEENSIREYHPNGVLFKQRILISSLDWVWKIYDTNGKLVQEEFFESGVLKDTKKY